jgi:uncharacterized protein (TIGR03066 family)
MRLLTALTLSLAALLTLGLASARCAEKPKDLIVGKWEPGEPKGKGTVLEFKKDGTLAVAIKDEGKEIKFDGTYKFLTDDTMEITMDVMGQKMTEKITLKKIDKDGMTTVDAMGKEEKFKRLK